MLKRAAAILVLTLAACEPAPAPAPTAPSVAPVPTPPRAALFADPEREQAKISPDGKWLSYIDRREGRRTLTAAPFADRVDARRIAEGADAYVWSRDGAHIAYRVAESGAWRIVDLLATGKDEPLPAAPVAAPPQPPLAPADAALLKEKLQAFEIVSRSADDARWVVREESPALAPRVWLYDRAAKSVERLFSERPPLEGAAFSAPKPVVVAGADGMLFQPPEGREARGLVVLLRGPAAPALRAFNAEAQYFAGLGYAVLDARTSAAPAEVSRWAVAQKLVAAGADIALLGESNALAALPLANEFGCAVIALSSREPGKGGDPQERVLLVTRGGGAAPNAAFAAHADFADETEGFARAQNRIAFYALAAAFVSACLKQPPTAIGGDLRNSSVKVLTGQNLLPTLEAAMAPEDSAAGAPP